MDEPTETHVPSWRQMQLQAKGDMPDPNIPSKAPKMRRMRQKMADNKARVRAAEAWFEHIHRNTHL